MIEAQGAAAAMQMPEASIFDRIRNNTALRASAVMLTLAGCTNETGGDTQQLTLEDATTACASAEFADLSSNANFSPSAFLPKHDQNIDGGAENLVVAYFATKKIDKAGQASLMASVVTPATDNKKTNPAYNYSKVYKETVARYNATDGLEQARADCKQAADVLTQVASDDPAFVEKGAAVTTLAADRNKAYQITGMTLRTANATGNLGGILFKGNETDRVDGFTPVLWSENGDQIVTGVTVGEGANNEEDANAPAGQNDQKETKGPSGTNQTQAPSGTRSASASASASASPSRTGSAPRGSTPRGANPTPERSPSVGGTSPAPERSPSVGGTSPAPERSPSVGGTSPAPERSPSVGGTTPAPEGSASATTPIVSESPIVITSPTPKPSPTVTTASPTPTVIKPPINCNPDAGDVCPTP